MDEYRGLQQFIKQHAPSNKEFQQLPKHLQQDVAQARAYKNNYWERSGRKINSGHQHMTNK